MNYNHHLALLFLTRAEGSHKTGIIDLLNYTRTLRKAPPAPAFRRWFDSRRSTRAPGAPHQAQQTSPHQHLPALQNGTFGKASDKPSDSSELKHRGKYKVGTEPEHLFQLSFPPAVCDADVKVQPDTRRD